MGVSSIQFSKLNIRLNLGASLLILYQIPLCENRVRGSHLMVFVHSLIMMLQTDT